MGKWLNIFVILLTIIIACLQLLPAHAEDEQEYITWLRKNALYIVFFLGSIIVVLHVYDMIKAKDRNRTMWLKEFLHYIIMTRLGGNNYHTRATILTVKPGWRIVIPYLMHAFVFGFITNFKRHTWVRKWHNIPIHLATDYLVVYVRDCFPSNSHHSYTHIRVMDKKDVYNGIADKCYREGVVIPVNTTGIDGLPLADTLAKNSPEIQSKVKKYMKDSYIDESLYNTIINMNTIANNLYAIPIPRPDRSIWGVLIFDNNEAKNKAFNDELKDGGAYYADIISLTVTTFKS